MFEALISSSSIISFVKSNIAKDDVSNFVVEDSICEIKSRSLIIYASLSTLLSALYNYYANNILSLAAPSYIFEMNPCIENNGVFNSCATFPINSFLY